MQRRAAGIYFVFFLVIGAGAFGYTTVVDAQRPTVQLEDPDHSLSQGDSLTVDGQEYTLTELTAEGGEEGIERSGTLEWTNESGLVTSTVENATNVTYEGEQWTVLVTGGANATAFTLRETQNVSAILADDPTVADETVIRDGERWVIYSTNESLKEPLADYLPEPNEETFAVGDTFPYQGNQTTVRAVSPADGVTLGREATVTNTIDLSSGGNVTVGSQTYLAYFPDNATAQLTSNYQNYLEDIDRQNYFEERKNGLMGLSIVSFLSAIVLGGAAFLPVKD